MVTSYMLYEGRTAGAGSMFFSVLALFIVGKFVNHATDGQGGNAEFRKAAEVGPGVDRTGAVARRTDYSLADIAATLYMARLEMLKLARLWDHKPGVAEWWRRIKGAAVLRDRSHEMVAPRGYRTLCEVDRSVDRCE